MAAATPPAAAAAADATPSRSGSKASIKQPENFWSEGGHKRVVKRVEDGIVCLDEFAKMVQERAELEKKHAKSLLDWAHRWDTRLEKAPSFKEGTLDNAWRALLTEAESSAAVLQELETVLRTEVKDTLIQWKKQNYPRFLGRNKVAKKVASDFEKARKPYEKATNEENKKKHDYYALAAKAHDLEHHINQAKQYATPTSEKDIRQLQAELDKTKPQLAKAKSVYEEKVRARAALTDSYRRDMAAAFRNCQEIEKRRIEFFVQVLRKYQNLVAQSQNAKLAESDRALQTSIGAVNADNDLSLYSAKHGIDMPFSIDAQPEPWTPAKTVAPTEESFAEPGSLQGAWFLKMAEKHGRAHRRFFVLDDKNLQLQYFEKLVRGVPEMPKGTIKLKEVRAVELNGKVMTLVTPSRRWVLSPAPKDEKVVGASPNMEDWSQRIAQLLNLPITRSAAAAVPAVAAVAATTVTQQQQQQPQQQPAHQQPEHQEPDSDESDHEGAAIGAGAAVVAGAAVAGVLLTGAGHAAAGAAGAASGAAGSAASGLPLLVGGVPGLGSSSGSKSAVPGPVRFVVARRGPTHVKLTWMPPTGETVSHYQLLQDGVAQPVVIESALEHTVNGLAPSTTHRFHLYAYTAKGPSAPASLTINTLAVGAPEENMEFNSANAAYTQQHHAAATQIQSVYRGNKAREHAAALREHHELTSKEVSDA